MKVILSAFGGKLRSEPMDWPDQSPPDIRMTLGMNGNTFFDHNGRQTINELERATVCVFRWTGQWFVTGGEKPISAKLYTLVDIERR